MALEISHQYKYSGRGPLDTKALVKKFEDLISESTWLTDNDKIAAYNGMIVAVWQDADNNGIYYLHDPKVTSTFKAPDVTDEANWHRLAELSDLENIVSRFTLMEASLADFNDRLTTLEEESDVITHGYRSGFPVIGEPNKLYVAVDEQKSYIWFNNEFKPVGNVEEGYKELEIIYGGNATK